MKFVHKPNDEEIINAIHIMDERKAKNTLYKALTMIYDTKNDLQKYAAKIEAEDPAGEWGQEALYVNGQFVSMFYIYDKITEYITTGETKLTFYAKGDNKSEKDI